MALHEVKKLMIAASLLSSIAAQAHPVLVKIKSAPDLRGLMRSSLLAFSSDGTHVTRIPFQVDELEDDSLLVMRKVTKELPVREKLRHPKDRDPFRDMLTEYHRITFNDSDFQKCDELCSKKIHEQAKKLCASSYSPAIFRIDLTQTKNSAFLASCPSLVDNAFPNAVDLNLDNRTFESPKFSLKYSKSNPIVMDEFTFNRGKKLIGSSTLEVMVKPRLFLPLHFTEDDLHSEMTAYNQNGVCTESELAMKLKTLGITTSFEICCDMTVYNDSFYFPIVLDLPFKGTSTREGSGIYFGFNFLGDLNKDVVSNLPNYPAKAKNSDKVLILKNGKNALVMGLRQPQETKGDSIAMSLISPKLAKKIGFNTKDSNTGVFFDITKIKTSGVHRLEMWFYSGPAEDLEKLKEYAQSGIQYRVSSVPQLPQRE